jgi:hypothetical protein
MRTFSFTLAGSLKEQGTPAFAERLFAIRGDPADEMIAATSVVHNATLLSASTEVCARTVCRLQVKAFFVPDPHYCSTALTTINLC